MILTRMTVPAVRTKVAGPMRWPLIEIASAPAPHSALTTMARSWSRTAPLPLPGVARSVRVTVIPGPDTGTVALANASAWSVSVTVSEREYRSIARPRDWTSSSRLATCSERCAAWCLRSALTSPAGVRRDAVATMEPKPSATATTKTPRRPMNLLGVGPCSAR